MPRAAKPENAAQQVRTEKWRKKQCAARRPEASHVDVALAAAIAALLKSQEEASNVSSELSTIVRTASKLLEKKYDKEAANRKLLERLRFRKDLPRLQAALMPPKLVTTRSANE
ncbi:hypothetical protein [Rhizobium pisi]|uniref:hypothetical protein n=1 Tax=Rhizobium pisi TaxID=574561 RepID=UPI003D03A1BC